MAIALDSSSKSGTAWLTGSPTTLTWAHTCSGSDRVLVVYVYASIGSDAITGITYNGSALTRIHRLLDGASENLYLYYLIAPSTGANNIVVSSSPGNNYYWGAAESYTGAKQSGQPDSYNTNVQTSTSVTFSTTVVATGSWLVLGTRGSLGTAGTGTTLRQDGTNGTQTRLFDSNGTVSSGSQSLIVTGASDTLRGIIASIAPVATASGPANLKSLNTNLTANIKSVNGNVIANCKSYNTNV